MIVYISMAIHQFPDMIVYLSMAIHQFPDMIVYLSMFFQYSVLDEPIAEAVVVVADTDDL